MNPTALSSDALWIRWGWLVSDTASIYTWTSDRELAWLAELAKGSRRLCEIGVWHGRATKVMARANPDCEIHAIDIFNVEGCKEEFCKNLEPELKSGQVVLHHGDAWDMLPLLPDATGFDGCFIDGAHLEENVGSDINALIPRMNLASIMAGHDWRPRDMNDGVNRAVIGKFGVPPTFESIWFVRL